MLVKIIKTDQFPPQWDRVFKVGMIVEATLRDEQYWFDKYLVMDNNPEGADTYFIHDEVEILQQVFKPYSNRTYT